MKKILLLGLLIINGCSQPIDTIEVELKDGSCVLVSPTDFYIGYPTHTKEVGRANECSKGHKRHIFK